jgi:acetyl-CoA acetyltransferase
MTRRAPYHDVVVATPVTIPYVRFSIKGAHWFLGRAVAELVKRSGIAKERIEGLCVSSFTLAPDTAIGFSDHIGLSTRWLDFIPLGGACGVVALRRAARAVQSGDAEIVACVSGDTNGVDSFRQGTANFSRFARDAVYPMGAGGPNASFAFLTAYYMRTFGATPADFGKMCVAQRANALKFPHALFKTPLTLDDYLKARMVSDPIRLFDCVMPCAGAEGFLVLRRELAEELGLKYARILATIERHNTFQSDPVQFRGGWALERDELYAQAGVAPADIDFIEVYDDYPVINMLQLEDLGFCEKGDAPAFVRAHSMTVDGSFPLNTSGGQLSVGQAGAAGGMLGLVEAIRQLTGEVLGGQVPDAKLGLVSGFGMINYDRGLCSGATILAAANA